MKRPGSGPFSEPIARVTPPEFRTDAIAFGNSSGNGPILLTRRKERRKTLPLDLPGGGASPPPEPLPIPTPAAAAPTADGIEDPEWVDLDVDAPDGTGG